MHFIPTISTRQALWRASSVTRWQSTQAASVPQPIHAIMATSKSTTTILRPSVCMKAADDIHENVSGERA